jgi:SLT domain-containing protein
MARGILIGTGFVRIDADTSPASKALQGLGAIGGNLLTTAMIPATQAITSAAAAGAASVTASFAAAGAAVGAFGAAVVPQFKMIAEANEKQQAAQEAQTKADVSQKIAKDAAREAGVEYGQAIKITADMSESAREKAEDYNKALQASETATKAADKSQALYNEKLKAMTPATRETSQAYQKLKGAVDDWSASLSATTMPIFTRALNGMREALPKLTPFVRTASTEIQRFVTSLGEGQAGATFRAFGANLQTNAGGALRSFLDVARNLAVGITGILNAFMPMSAQMSGGLVDLTARFADFGAGLSGSQGLTDFMAGIEQHGPAVVQLLSSIASVVGDVVAAAGPLGGISLQILSAFAAIVDAIPTPVLQALVPAIIAVNIGLKAWAVYQGVAAGATWAFTTAVTTQSGAVYASRAALVAARVQLIATAVAQRASAAATGVATAAQWLWNAAMSANPIGLVIAGIALLVGAFVLAYKKSETFRNIVQGALDAIRVAAQAVVSGVMTAWNWLSGGLTATWDAIFNNVIAPIRDFFTVTIPGWATFLATRMIAGWTMVWNGIKVVWDLLFNSVIAPIRDFFTVTIPTWTASLATRMIAGWTMVWNGIKSVWDMIFNNVIAPIRDFFTVTIPGWAGRLVEFVVTHWNVLRARLLGVWRMLMINVIIPIRTFFTVTIPGWAATVKDKVVGAFEKLKNGIKTVWDWIRTRIFNPVRDFFTKTIPGWAGTMKDKVVGFFEKLRDGVGTMMDKVRSKAKTPINWVLENVWNKGIVSVWGKIAGWIGIGNALKKVKLLAAGGTVGNEPFGVFNRPTAIVGEGRTSRPEYVIPTDPKYGVRARSLWAAAGQQLGMPQMMESGGIIGTIGGWLGGAADTVGNFGKAAVNFLSDPLGSAKKMFDGVLGRLKEAGTSTWAKAIAELPRKAVDGLLKAVKKIGSSALSAIGLGPSGGSGVQRWRPVVQQVLKMVGQPQAYTDITLRRMNQESGGNPTVVNKWDSNWHAGYPSVGLMQVIRPTFQSHAGRMRNVGPFLYGVSTNPAANIYASMRYALSRYGSLPRAYNRAGGYALGTAGSSPGWHWVGEHGAELMKLPAGVQVRSHAQSVRQERAASGPVTLVIQNHGIIASRREAEDWLVSSLEELARKNRLPRSLKGGR